MSLIQESRSRDEEILSCVERGLDKVGPGVKKYVYWHIQKRSHVERDDILTKPALFVQGLQSIYHESSIAVQNSIVEEINSTFDLSHSPAQLAEAITRARKSAQSK